jgi:Uri superfamily endonuclease
LFNSIMVTGQGKRAEGERDGCLPQGIRREPGTYALIMRAQSQVCVQVGKWGALNVTPGCYIYVGSAFGPGGVAARVGRHCRETASRYGKRLRWHIDYLRHVTRPEEVWCAYGGRELEHQWAQAFSRLDEIASVSGFGCSDCRCDSHLFFSLRKPAPRNFSVFARTQLDIFPIQAVAMMHDR